MTIVGTGVDIIEIDRIASSIDRWGIRFARKILMESELDRFKKYQSKAAAYLARQFAAKEAVAKALGTGMRAGVTFPQIGVERLESGAPVIILTGRALERSQKLAIDHWHVSISDEKDYAVAFIVAESMGKMD